MDMDGYVLRRRPRSDNTQPQHGMWMTSLGTGTIEWFQPTLAGLENFDLTSLEASSAY